MASLGLMANDDVLYEAPLAAWAGEFTETASFWHRRIEVLIFAIIVLHLAAIATYRFLLGQNLIPAMIHGGVTGTMPLSAGGCRLQVSCCLSVLCCWPRYWDTTATVSTDQSL